jgi:hypothetical protein
MRKPKALKPKKRGRPKAGVKPPRGGDHQPSPKRIRGMKDKFSDLIVVEYTVARSGGKP